VTTSPRVPRSVRLLLAVVLALSALVAAGSAGAATENGRLYWVNSQTGTLSSAAIGAPTGGITTYATGDIPNSVFATSSALYWTSASSAHIGIANLQGAVQSYIAPGGTSAPTGVVVVGQFIYWADNGFIGRATITGAQPQTGWQWYQTPSGQNTSIWSDGAYIYWGDANSIGRIGLDGSGANVNFVSNAQVAGAVASPTSITSDGQRIYWINTGASQISSATVGTGLQVTPTYLALPSPSVGLTETGTSFFWTAQSGGSIGAANLTPAVTAATFINTSNNPTDVAASRWALTVAKAGTGAATSTVTAAGSTATQNGLSCGQICTNDFPDMATVTLTETAAPGFVFAGWAGACTGTAKTCTVTMNQSQNVQATFNPAVTNYVLTLTRKGTGAGSIVSSPVGLNCGTVCAAPFAKNTKVTLTAVEGPLADFVGWSGACSGFKAQSVCTVTMSQARAASATFNPAPVLTLSKFAVTNSTFRVGSHTTAVRAYTPVGTTIKYTLSENANVTVAFQRPGYAKKQYLYRSSGAKGGKTGANAIAFTGRVGRTPLGGGRWKVIITASDSTTTTKAQIAYITIKK
jgi:uncharacterized repeat protein (TIGR02543 family)